MFMHMIYGIAGSILGSIATTIFSNSVKTTVVTELQGLETRLQTFITTEVARLNAKV